MASLQRALSLYEKRRKPRVEGMHKDSRELAGMMYAPRFHATSLPRRTTPL